jgi:hypothetical protein
MSLSPQPAFTPERGRTLRAVVERILPGDQGPGGAATHAAAGFESALLHPVYRGMRPGVEAVLDRLQSQAAKLHGQDFAACAPVEQDELLRALEQDPNPWTRLLFRSLIGFTVEGFLGDPIHGGNRDFLGWQAIGLQAEDVRSGFCQGARVE